MRITGCILAGDSLCEALPTIKRENIHIGIGNKKRKQKTFNIKKEEVQEW